MLELIRADRELWVKCRSLALWGTAGGPAYAVNNCWTERMTESNTVRFEFGPVFQFQLVSSNTIAPPLEAAKHVRKR
jgi:hypothetical protein